MQFFCFSASKFFQRKIAIEVLPISKRSIILSPKNSKHFNKSKFLLTGRHKFVSFFNISNHSVSKKLKKIFYHSENVQRKNTQIQDLMKHTKKKKTLMQLSVLNKHKPRSDWIFGITRIAVFMATIQS